MESKTRHPHTSCVEIIGVSYFFLELHVCIEEIVKINVDIKIYL